MAQLCVKADRRALPVPAAQPMTKACHMVKTGDMSSAHSCVVTKTCHQQVLYIPSLPAASLSPCGMAAWEGGPGCCSFRESWRASFCKLVSKKRDL